MKSAILLAVAVVIVSSLPVVLRHSEAAAQENAPMHAAGTPGNRPAAVIAQVPSKSSTGAGSTSGDAERGR
jgi:hypothetical protein